jgi:hypothetical protein
MNFKLKDVFHTAVDQQAGVTADAKPAIDLGGALLPRGSNAPVQVDSARITEPVMPTAPTVDGGTFEPAKPVMDPVEQKVLAFIRICHVTDGLTYREISGGCDLPIAEVKHALESLVERGTIRHSGDTEPNYRRYSLTSPIPESPASAPQTLSPSEQWAIDARQRADAEEAAKRSPEPKRYEPSETDVTAELQRRKSVAPLTPEERQQLEPMRGRVPRNPQAFVKR